MSTGTACEWRNRCCANTEETHHQIPPGRQTASRSGTCPRRWWCWSWVPPWCSRSTSGSWSSCLDTLGWGSLQKILSGLHLLGTVLKREVPQSCALTRWTQFKRTHETGRRRGDPTELWLCPQGQPPAAAPPSSACCVSNTLSLGRFTVDFITEPQIFPSQPQRNISSLPYDEIWHNKRNRKCKNRKSYLFQSLIYLE